MAKMKVTLSGGDFADQVTEWTVDEELIRLYSTFWAGWVAKGLVISALTLGGADGVEDGTEKLLAKVS
jgi:hypothetical protein